MNYKTRKIILPILLITLLLQLQIHAQTKAWGKNLDGELGIGTLTIERNPVIIPSMSNTTGISGGYDHTLILQPNGTVMATGSNSQGQLGDGTTTRRTTPVAVSGLTNIRQVSGCGLFSTALRSDGTVWSWGENFYGHVGNGTTGSAQLTPAQATISGVIQVDAGFYHNLALKSDGTVWAWGGNEYGQIGNNSTIDTSLPVQVGVGVAGFSNIIAVSAGNLHSMALKSDGTVWVWGRNSSGQIGNGSAGDNQLTPVQNTTLTNIVQISAGRGHNLALKLDGTVWGWGFNIDGQVGNGVSGGNQLTPVQNTTASNIIEIETGGGDSSYARRKDGTVFSWGYNFFGSIGDGTSNNRLTPFQVLVDMGNVDIAADASTAFALKPVFSATIGTNQSYYGHNFSMVFDNIITGGDISVTAIDPTTTGLPLPSGYNIQPLQPAYDLTRTATTDGNIKVCIKVNEPNPANYPFLKILHEEAGTLIDRTTSFSATLGEVCSSVTSFSRFVIATASLTTPTNALFDFDGDGRSDISIFRPDPGNDDNNYWTVLQSSNSQIFNFEWGIADDAESLAPADYDGDGKTDFAIYRRSENNFYIYNSSDDSVRIENLGIAGDKLTVGDWDNDDKADISVYREGSQSYFYFRGSNNNPNNNISYFPWGMSGDKPISGDFDGDGIQDAAVFRPSNGVWYIYQSTDGQVRYVNFGLANDKLIPADYDGDSKTDIAVFRDGVWYILQSSNGQIRYEYFGLSNDTLVPADYDGDGKTDVAVFRDGTWYLNQTTSGFVALQFGLTNDKAIPNTYINQ